MEMRASEPRAGAAEGPAACPGAGAPAGQHAGRPHLLVHERPHCQALRALIYACRDELMAIAPGRPDRPGWYAGAALLRLALLRPAGLSGRPRGGCIAVRWGWGGDLGAGSGGEGGGSNTGFEGHLQRGRVPRWLLLLHQLPLWRGGLDCGGHS